MQDGGSEWVWVQLSSEWMCVSESVSVWVSVWMIWYLSSKILLTSAIMRLVSPRKSRFRASSSLADVCKDRFFRWMFWSGSSIIVTFLVKVKTQNVDRCASSSTNWTIIQKSHPRSTEYLKTHRYVWISVATQATQVVLQQGQPRTSRVGVQTSLQPVCMSLHVGFLPHTV